MRRSLYQRTFFKGSTLYREDLQRRPSTLPPHVQSVAVHPLCSMPQKSLVVPLAVRQEGRTRCPPPRLSSSDAKSDSRLMEVMTRRPYRSTTDDGPEFPLRIKKDLSVDTFRRSQDSESSSSYLSPRSHHSISNTVEELEMDVFSRQSSSASDEMHKRSKRRSERILSFQDSLKRDSTDTNDETWKTCASLGETTKSDPLSDSPVSKFEDFTVKSKETISWEGSVESEGSISQSVIDVTKGEGYDFALKQFETFDKLCRTDLENKDSGDENHSNKTDSEFFRHGLFQWNKSYEDYDSENLASNREEAAIAFKIDFYPEHSERDSNSPVELSENFNYRRSLFPGKKKTTTPTIEENEHKQENDPLHAIVQETDRDEGFDSPVYESRDADELGDMFASRQELMRKDGFRKERSLDSDETSGFISKHSSETTDLSSRLSSTQFTTKHLSEPLGFGSAGSPSDMPRQQHLSEPSDMPQHLTSTGGPELPEPEFGSMRLLSVEEDLESSTSGAISKRRELFRKSKRLKHFNLRRIDDTDNDSSCDSERPQVGSEDANEPPSTRLREEVGLPKHLSRDSSVDRYGLYKSRSEKTITSFESDRGGQARLQDFESFLDAVNFTHQLPDSRKKAASADELDLSDMEVKPASSHTPPRQLRRKSRSKRDLTRRLKCLLL